MPARKSVTLNQQHYTKRERFERESAEEALTPNMALPINPPVALKGHKHAVATWKHTHKINSKLEKPLIVGSDIGIVVDYCLLVEQLVELDKLRDQSLESCELIRKNLKALTAKMKYKDAKTILAEQLAVNEKLESILALIIKLDGRIDRKRGLIHTLRQSLYLTPRSRAGVAPAEREKEIKTEMDQLLDELD